MYVVKNEEQKTSQYRKTYFHMGRGTPEVNSRCLCGTAVYSLGTAGLFVHK